MKTLSIHLQTEWMKIKRTPVLYFILAGVALIPIVTFIILVSKPEYFTPSEGANPWMEQIYRSYRSICFLLIPAFIALITALMLNIEQKALAFKQLFTYPHRKHWFYYSKLLLILLLIAATFILFNLITYLLSHLAALFRPELAFNKFSPDWIFWMKLTLKSFIGTLGILGIQYYLSSVIKNFIWPVSIGIGLSIAALIIMKWKNSMYIPYLQPTHALNDSFASSTYLHLGAISAPELVAIGSFLLVVILGFEHFKRLKW